MTLLQLVTSPQLWGAEVFALNLSRALEDRGVETAVVFLYRSEDEPELPTRPRDRRLDGRKEHPAEKALGFHPGLLIRGVRRIRELRPDIVQTSGSRSVKYAALSRRLQPGAGWLLVYRAIGDPRAWRSPGPRPTLFEGSILFRFDAFVAVSRQALDGLQATGKPMEQIPRGIDLDRCRLGLDRTEVRRRLGIPKETTVLVYVGRLSTEKRLDSLIRVAERVARRVPGVELWIVGDGPLRHKVATARNADRAAVRIRALGVLEDVADLMAAADLVLLSSETEGVPGVVLEAAAIGLPAVATRVGGVPQCVIHGRTGLLADPDDEGALVRAVVSLLDDGEICRRLGASARVHVAKEFALHRVAERYLTFYPTLLFPPSN